MFLGINQCPLRPSTIFALQYETKLNAVRAANENVVPQSLPIFSPERKNVPSTLHSNSSITTSLGFGFFVNSRLLVQTDTCE